MNQPDLARSPGIPTDDDGPVFAEPWEARAFALALRCHEQGLFDWPSWAEALAATIREEPELAYYRQWLLTLETLLARTGTVPDAERLQRIDAWNRAARATPHGEPIVLGRDTQDT